MTECYLTASLLADPFHSHNSRIHPNGTKGQLTFQWCHLVGLFSFNITTYAKQTGSIYDAGGAFV